MACDDIKYPWYEIVGPGEGLMQGDLIEGYERAWEFDDESQEAIVDKYNLVIMSQSCDIPKKSATHLTLCPVLSFEEVAAEWPDIKHPKNKEEMRKGNITGLHLLNQCGLEGFSRPFRAVIFKRIFQAPKIDLISFVRSQDRLRLLPPYREHLAQAFARFFMRVGLPSNIPEFK